MFLNEDKIHELVSDHVAAYLSSATLSFFDLKNKILSKAPIPEIQNQIVSTFNKAKNDELIQIVKRHEAKACDSEFLRKKNNQLEKKYANLIHNAALINFSIFLDELQILIGKPRIKLPQQEIDALKNLLQLIRTHADLEYQVSHLNDSLQLKQQLLDRQVFRFKGLRAQSRSLEENNPDLITKNEMLQKQNTALQNTLKQNNELRQKLTGPALILLTLTFIFLLPLILTIASIIPVFIAPVFLYILFSVPPIATLCLGTTALFCILKATSENKTIQANIKAIESISHNIDRNIQNLNAPQIKTISTLKTKIEKETTLIEQLIASAKKITFQSNNILKQAEAIKPFSSAKHLFITKNPETQNAVEKTTVFSKLEC